MVAERAHFDLVPLRVACRYPSDMALEHGLQQCGVHVGLGGSIGSVGGPKSDVPTVSFLRASFARASNPSALSIPNTFVVCDYQVVHNEESW